MNKLEIEYQKYKNNKISKEEYINNMNIHHQVLFDYSEFFKSGFISEIIIKNGAVFVKIKRNDILMYCDRHDKRSIPFEMLNFGSFEEIELTSVFSIIKKNLAPDFIAYDIGGNIGWYAMELSKEFPNSIIHTFEPIPETFLQLQENINLNNIVNVNLHNFGLSNEDKELVFYYDNSLSVAASLKNIMNKKDIVKVKSRVRLLDDCVNDISDRIDFIKCDVEGAELLVFEGGINVLKNFKPIIFTEMLRKWSAKFNYHPNDIIKFLNKLDYNCYKISDKGNLINIVEITEETVETNFIFLHNKKHKI